MSGDWQTSSLTNSVASDQAGRPVQLALSVAMRLGQSPDSPLCMRDLIKAFDSVDRETASQILLSRGAPTKLVALIRALHTRINPQLG